MYSPDPSLPYRAFRQACRAFRPTDLVRAIAKKSASLGEPPYPSRTKNQYPPWGLAAAARESILFGNEYRHKVADDKALTALMHKFQIAMDISNEEIKGGDLLLSLTTRLAHEQIPYAESAFEEVSRSHAWLVEGIGEVDTQVITEASLAQMLDGISLREAIGATFFMQVGAFQNEGRFEPGWLDQPNFANVFEVYPRHTIETIAARLVTTPEAFKLQYEKWSLSTDSAARFDYNPLVATPFVDMGDGPVAPAARLILRTISPGSLYYAGMAAHGNAFAADLGNLFEYYVGRQLRLIPDAGVHPEIVFGKGGGLKSVDWFVVLPGVVLLIEAKSKRLGPAARAGDPSLVTSLDSSLGEARKQLSKTVERLSEGHEAFSHIPTDRPMVALVVTAEPFYTAGAYLMDYSGGPTIAGGVLPDVPVGVMSARDLEALVTHGQDVEGIVLDLLARRGEGVFGFRDLIGKEDTRNPILQNAWDSYPWPSDIMGAADDVDGS
jgi:hypothetical protein